MTWTLDQSDGQIYDHEGAPVTTVAWSGETGYSTQQVKEVMKTDARASLLGVPPKLIRAIRITMDGAFDDIAMINEPADGMLPPPTESPEAIATPPTEGKAKPKGTVESGDDAEQDTEP